MGLINLLIAGAVHFAVVLLDIAIAFCVVRMLHGRFSWQLLAAFDEAGRPLVDWLACKVKKPVCRLWGRPLPPRYHVAAALTALALARALLISLFTLVFAL